MQHRGTACVAILADNQIPQLKPTTELPLKDKVDCHLFANEGQ